MGVAAPLFLSGEERDSGSPDADRELERDLRSIHRERREESRRVLSVLLVEDDPAMRLLCTFNLEASGFRVVTATTGAEALEAAAEGKFDVVLLDVMLPDLGGFDVAERLHGLPIVFLSARVAEADIEHGRTVGAMDYVTKPFDPVALPTRVREDVEALRRGGSPEGVWAMRFGERTD